MESENCGCMKGNSMKKIVIFILALVFVHTFAHTEKLAEFDDVFKNPNILMDNKQLYIWDSVLLKVNIYSRRGFKKITEFVRRGEGPGEVNFINTVSITDKHVCITSQPKVCFFSKNGEFIEEIKGPSDAGGFIPFLNNFVGQSYPRSKHMDEKGKIQFSLFDSNLKKKKDIFLTESRKIVRYGKRKTVVSWINDCTRPVVSDDRLYIASTDSGFYIAVFDSEGNKLYEINKPYEKRWVTNADKQRMIESARKTYSDSEWEEYKARYEIWFPEYFPAFANFTVHNGKIYIFSYPEAKSQETFIFDLTGTLQKHRRVDVKKPLRCIPYGKFVFRFGWTYFLEENEDTGNWELHRVKIE